MILAIKTVSCILGFLSHEFVTSLPVRLKPVLKYLQPGLYKAFYRNHKLAFSEASEVEINELVKGSLISYTQNKLITLKYLYRKNFHFDRYSGNEAFLRMYGKQPIIHILAHCGPHPLILYLLGQMTQVPVIGIRRPEKNKKLERILCEQQAFLNARNVPLYGAAVQVEEVLSNNGVVLLALDAVQQLPARYMTCVKFFGRNFKMANGLIWLSRKYNAPIIPIAASFDENFQLQYHVYAPLAIDSSANPMQSVADSIQSSIEQHSDTWNLPDNYWPDLTL